MGGGPGNRRQKLHQQVPGPTTQCLTRLAKAFNVDAEALMMEFQDHQKVAQVFKDQRPHDPASAIWQRTLRRTQECWQMREQWPAKALLPVTQRLLVAPGSTSGVEQALNRFKRLMGEQWHGSAVAEERRLVLQLKAAAEPKPPPELLKAARRTWAECFGKARASGTQRTPSLGMRSSRLLKRKATEALRGASSATRWLAKRREEVEAKASKLPDSLEGPPVEGLAAWTQQHERERQHQHEERLERACAAVEEGTADRSCLRADSGRKMQDFRIRERRRQHDLDLQWRRKRAVHALPQACDCRGQRVYVEDATLVAGSAKWREAKRSAGVSEVEDRRFATIFVVPSPSEPGDRNGVIASMVGGLLATPSYFFTEAKDGMALKLKSALARPRNIFVSPGTIGKHKPMIDLMRHMSTRDGPQRHKRWRWLDGGTEEEKERFLDLGRRRHQGGHSSEMVTLVLAAERAGAFQRFPKQMTLREFLKSIWTLDRSFTRLGFCQR